MAVTCRITVSEKSSTLTRLARRPGSVKRSESALRRGFDPLAAALRYALVPTDWGVCGLLWQLHACSWPGQAAPAAGSAFAAAPVEALLCRIIGPGLPPLQLRQLLAGVAPLGAEILPDAHGHFASACVPPWFEKLSTFLQSYFGGAQAGVAGLPELPADAAAIWQYWRPRLNFASVTAFQAKVLDQVARIPSGEVRTYGQVAKTVGHPTSGGARAIGSVMRSNPWPILIPCHRVVGVSGALTGYSGPGKLVTKKRLLELEAAAKKMLNWGDLTTKAPRQQDDDELATKNAKSTKTRGR